MKSYLLKTLVFIILFFPIAELVSASTPMYLSPVPNSKFNNENTNIIIGFSGKLNNGILNNINIKVSGSKSGIHSGTLMLAEKNYRLIFKPETPFALGEAVTVSGVAGVEDFTFYIRERVIKADENSYRETSGMNLSKSGNFHPDYLIRPDSLPAFTIYNSGNTASGYLFLSNFNANYQNGNYIMVLQNNGAPVFSRLLTANGYDFKKQNENLLTYFEEMKHFYLGLNSSYVVVDSFYCGNGYSTDLHEVRVMQDGSAWLMSYDVELVDMSQIVPGGRTNANVTGLVIQKINPQKEVVFQWRSWDYFQITDATHEDLTAFLIDYVHGNSIEVDNDGNIIISSRHMDEITKINSETGAIIWRLGGKNNQFTCNNDTLWFSHQHYARRLANDNIMLFDNGNYHTPTPFSRVLEYKIDESALTVHLDWQYRHTPDIYAFAMGSAQRLSNGNTLIGWGSATTTLTEVNSAGNVVYELTLPSPQMSYRAYRDEWGEFTPVFEENNTNTFSLKQNYPNPFNPSTSIRYSLKKSSNVILKVYDISGKEIATLANGFKNAGEYTVSFPGGNITQGQIPSGVYFYRLSADGFTEVKKMILIK